ncbi:MAG: metal ABC transporter ATP-binding protein, partial [Chlamydiales bacterium]
ELIGIFGPNGGGKTTLLNLLLGFLKPTKGAIRIPAEVQKSIGWVPQNFSADPLFPISALEVVLMGRLRFAPRFGRYKKQDREIALACLKKVGMLRQQHVAFGSLSGGQKQRVLIARALASEPQLLLLDEATANLDPSSTAALFQLLHNLKKGMTILMVTHDLKLAVDQFDRLLCVEKGIIPMKSAQVCKHFGEGLYHQKRVEVFV